MKKILKHDSNSRQIQDVVPISNLKARKIKTLLSLPIHLAHHRIAAAAVAPFSLRCCYCRSCCRSCYCSCCLSAVSPAVASLLLRCCSAVAPLSLCYLSTVDPLSLSCRFCRSVSAAVTHAVATLPLLLLLLMSLHCHS